MAGGRIHTSVKLPPDLFADAVVCADRLGISLGHLVEVALARIVHGQGMHQRAESMSLPRTDDGESKP